MKYTHYELPIKEAAALKWRENMDNPNGYLAFRLADDVEPTTLFLNAHGNEQGQMNIGGHLLDTEQVLRTLISNTGIKDLGITHVLTLSCHGGYQKEVTIDGITIKSFHNSKLEIDTRAMELWDGGWVLEVYVPEEGA